MTALVLDIRFALRRLLARRAVSTVILLSLALGIGANAVIFSLGYAFLSGATPYPDPDRVVLLWFTPPADPGARTLATHGNCAALRERARRFEHVGCVLPDRTATFADVGDHGLRTAGAARSAGQEFTAGVAEALGVQTILGRWFTIDEEQRGEPVVVISHRFWRRHFDGAADIIGRRVRATNQGLTSEIVTIVGVAPDGFQLLDARTDYWLPLAVPSAARASPARRFLVVGRLSSGVALREAQEELNAIAAGLAADTPLTNTGWGIRAEPVRAALRHSVGRPVLILQAVVSLVLLIACGNVAGLLLAEGVARRGEVAVRSAVGASRGRILRQWLTESLVMAILGGVLALAFAWAGLRLLLAWLPAEIPGLSAVSLHPTVLAITAAVSVITSILAGISPAIRASGVDAAHALNRFGRPGQSAGSAQRLRSAFVVAQISLAIALSIGAGLMIHSLLRLHAVAIGVETSDLMTFQVQLDGREYLRETGRSTPSGASEVELRPRLFAAAGEIRERLAAIPGVRGASALSATAPLSGVARTYGFVATGSKLTGPDVHPVFADWFAILPEYFRTLGVPVLQGRGLDASDTAAGLPVVVINTSLAAELWPGEDPVGREIQMRLFNDPPRRVVGVVADVRQSAGSSRRLRQVYVPFAQLRPVQSGVVAEGLEQLTFVVRSAGEAARSAEIFRQVVGHVEPLRPVTRVQPLQEYVDGQLSGFRLYVILLGLFGTVAVGLAMVGTFGLMAHSVNLRVQEIGIRLALGAGRGRVLWLIMRRGLGISIAGILVGLVGGLMFSGVLESYLWEVTVTDPLTYTIVPGALAVVSLLACYLASRRALQIDPAAVIRQE